jgi:hypothetical protein
MMGIVAHSSHELNIMELWIIAHSSLESVPNNMIAKLMSGCIMQFMLLCGAGRVMQ